MRYRLVAELPTLPAVRIPAMKRKLAHLLGMRRRRVALYFLTVHAAGAERCRMLVDWDVEDGFESTAWEATYESVTRALHHVGASGDFNLVEEVA